MANLIVPQEFTYENFTKIIQDVIPDNNYYALKNIFPMTTVMGNKIKNTILNFSRAIITGGVRNKGDVSFNVDKMNYDSKVAEMFPYILNHIFEADEFQNLNDLGDQNREIEIARWITDNMSNLKTIIYNTWEYFGWQLLLNGGVLDLTDNDNAIHYKYDFECAANQKVAANTLASTAKWDDYTNGVSNPLKDIVNWKKKLKAVGGAVGNLEMIANSNTWEIFRGNPKVTADSTLSDMLKNSFFTGLFEGVKVQGVGIKVLDDTYENESGVITDYIPDGYLVMKSSGQLGDMQMGTSRIIPNMQVHQFQTIQGLYSYPILQQEPAAVKAVTGFKSMINLQKRFNFLIAKAY